MGRRLSRILSKRFTSWQTLVLTLVSLYVARNFGKLIGLECPEPLAELYTRSFFRATWITTALDAGFWSAMRIRRKWLREVSSVVFTLYYLVCAEQADEKVRKIRAVLTVDHLRISWNKSTTPYVAAFGKLTRPRFMRYQPRAIRIPRPETSSYTEPVQGWLYFDGPLSSLKKQTKLVLNIPGGGFVAMNPRNHDDALFAWAGKTGLPVLSLDYRKAPEFPYPYALNECYDVYHMIIASQGRCLGLSGDVVPQIVVSGDSAGGNLATGVVLMVLQSGSTKTRRWFGEEDLPPPVGLVLIYPALDMNIGNWMTDEQMALIRDRRVRDTNKRIVREKSNDFRKLAPSTPMVDDDDDVQDGPNPDVQRGRKSSVVPAKPSDLSEATVKPMPLKTRLATPSLISYVSDRVLTPEMMRAMIILYIGPHNRPDFSTDFLLSPVLAPDAILAAFPKTYFITGERDPLVDDTVIMAGRIRRAKAAAWRERQELGVIGLREAKRGFVERDWLEVKLIEGISHGFTQFAGIFPEAWDFIYRVGRWYEEAFALAEWKAERARLDRASFQATGHGTKHNTQAHNRHHHRSMTASSGDDDQPLEMSIARKAPGPNAASSPSKRINEADYPKQKLENGKHKPLSIDIPPAEDFLPDGSSSAWQSPLLPYTPLARDHPLGASHKKKGASSRARSMVSLASEDDLLGRRMKGLTAGLTRLHG